MKITFKKQPDSYNKNGLPWKIWQVEVDGIPAKNKFDEPLLVSQYDKYEDSPNWHNYDERIFHNSFPTLAEAKAAVTAHLEGKK